MAVASGEEALRALTELISGDRIKVQSILRDCYLPEGLEPSKSPILMKPDTLMGEYGDETRYALAPDQATRCEIARPPADVLSGRPMISSNETVRKYVGEKSRSDHEGWHYIRGGLSTRNLRAGHRLPLPQCRWHVGRRDCCRPHRCR